MKIKQAEFIKGITSEDELLRSKLPQVALIGRSNVGKSSLINALVGKKIARSSDTPGKTREINLYLINRDFYLVDLPGYGFAKGSFQDRNNLKSLVYSYLFFSDIEHKRIILIVDAEVGVTESDSYFIRRLEEQKKSFIVVANKTDKIKKSQYKTRIDKIRLAIGDHSLILCSTKSGLGITELLSVIF